MHTHPEVLPVLALEWQFATPGLSQFPQFLEFKLIIDEMGIGVRILYSNRHTHVAYSLFSGEAGCWTDPSEL